MDDKTLEMLRELDGPTVAHWVGIEPRRGVRHKWACPGCGSSDNLDIRSGRRTHPCYTPGCSPEGQERYGNVDLVMAALQMPFLDAAAWLARQAGLDPEHVPSREDMQRLEEARRQRAKDQAARQQERLATMVEQQRIIGEWYPHLELTQVGRDYLASRSIPHLLAHKFGFCSIEAAGWADCLTVLSDADRRALALPRDVPGTDVLVIPYQDYDRSLTTLRFRAIGKASWRYASLSGVRPEHPFQAPFVEYAARIRSTLYVTEGELDALSVCAVGSPCISSCGGSMWRQEWVKPWRAIERVVVLCDADAAGVEFGRSILTACLAVHGRSWTVGRLEVRQCPEMMPDANEMLRNDALADAIGPAL